MSASVTIRLIVEPVGAHQPPLDLPLELLEHDHRGHAGGERAAHDGGLLGAVEPLEQLEQAVEAQPAGGRERIVGVGCGRRVGHDR